VPRDCSVHEIGEVTRWLSGAVGNYYALHNSSVAVVTLQGTRTPTLLGMFGGGRGCPADGSWNLLQATPLGPLVGDAATLRTFFDCLKTLR